MRCEKLCEARQAGVAHDGLSAMLAEVHLNASYILDELLPSATVCIDDGRPRQVAGPNVLCCSWWPSMAPEPQLSLRPFMAHVQDVAST